MEPSFGIKLVWSLASREAMESGHERIEPGHLFNALLKFVELNSANLEALLKDQGLLPALLEEQKKSRTLFQERGLAIPQDTTPLRRRLRQIMGSGGVKHDRQSIVSRSEDSRQVCRRAEELAGADGSSIWQGVHLAASLMENPKGPMAEALKAGKADPPKPGHNAATPLLERYGRSWSPARPAASPPQISHPAVKVVLLSIQRERDGHLVLVEAGGPTALGVMGEVAALAGPDSGVYVRVDMASLARDWSQNPSLLESLFKEAAGAKAVLYLESLTGLLQKGFENPVVAALERILAQKDVRCIAGVDKTAYLALFPKKSPWGRLFRPVWLHLLPPGTG